MQHDPNTPADKVRTAFSQYPQHTYPKGHIVVFGNENPAGIFYMVRGSVRQYDISPTGSEVIVNVFKPPAFFPMSWAINHAPNRYFFKAEEPTTVHVVPAADALAFVKDNPDVLLDLLSRLYKGLDGLLGRVVHLMSGSARSRLLYELIVESRRGGKEQDNGDVVLTINETDIAARTGLTRETVSREMQHLKDQTWVSIAPGGITIRNLAALKNALGPEL